MKSSESFNLPIRILINVQVLKPGEFEYSPFKERYVSPVIMPNLPFKRRWRRYVKVYNKLPDDDGKNLKKHEFQNQVLGWVGQL